MLHMQHHILCNISYVVIAESMGKSLKYTTSVFVAHMLISPYTFILHCARVVQYLDNVLSTLHVMMCKAIAAFQP